MFVRRALKVDKHGRSSVKCEHCSSTITISSFQASQGNTTAALRTHHRRCIGSSDADRAVFKKTGVWPDLVKRQRRHA